MKKIIGLIMVIDGGKSLFIDILNKNFKDYIFVNSNTSDTYIVDDFNSGKIAGLSLADMVKTYGCDALPFPIVRNNLTKQKLINIYDTITDKPYVFIFVRAEDFHLYCDYGIYIGRDPRACWLVTMHRQLGVQGYASGIFPPFCIFQSYSNHPNVVVIKFENLIADQKKALDKIMNVVGLDIKDKTFIYSTPQYSKYFTMMDLFNLRKYTDAGDCVPNDDLDYLSEKGRDFNTFFNNPEYLHLTDILPETINKDIDDYMGGQYR